MYRLTLCLLVASATATAQPYTPPRTPDGYPDFQGVWAAGFLTRLERPPGVASLVVSREEAQELAATLRSQRPPVYDPQLDWDDRSQLALVKGTLRTSVVVEPESGAMPYTQAATDLAARIRVRNRERFDHPEQRPLMARCLENFAFPPVRGFPPALILHQIFQTRDHLVIASEGPVAVRIIHLIGEPPPDVVRSIEGYSAGSWDGDTLVVRTTHLRAEDPARFDIGRPILLSRDSRITERFRRVSATELFYQFTVDDDALYTHPWTGEFSLTRHDGPIYEYACHEGNYSMPTVLRGGQAQAETMRDQR